MQIITMEEYLNALSFIENDKAYIQQIITTDLVFKEEMFFLNGLPATDTDIRPLYSRSEIESYNLTMLHVFFAIILSMVEKNSYRDNTLDEEFIVYYPDLAKKLGKKLAISQEHINSLINTIKRFESVIGVINNGREEKSILPVLILKEIDYEKNTISFSSPYFKKLIFKIRDESIKKKKLNVNSVAYSYLPKMTLGKERNHKAVEIVLVVVANIERTGSQCPHISAKTIIERTSILKKCLEESKSASNKNTYLERAFEKAWKLLRTNTDICKRYTDIKLPDLKDKDFKTKYIPTVSTLDMVFEFPHRGKHREKNN